MVLEFKGEGCFLPSLVYISSCLCISVLLQWKIHVNGCFRLKNSYSLSDTFTWKLHFLNVSLYSKDWYTSVVYPWNKDFFNVMGFIAFLIISSSVTCFLWFVSSSYALILCILVPRKIRSHIHLTMRDLPAPLACIFLCCYQKSLLI